MTDMWQHHHGVAMFTFTFPYPAPPSRVLSLVNATERPHANHIPHQTSGVHEYHVVGAVGGSVVRATYVTHTSMGQSWLPLP